MTEIDIKRIEAELGHPVPESYRHFVIAHADELRKAEEAMPFRAFFYHNPDDVIRNNRFARDHARDVFPIGTTDEPFPNSYFMIGDNGGGDYWFIKRESPERGVWFYKCESHEVEMAYSSLQDYLDTIREDMRNPEVWQ